MGCSSSTPVKDDLHQQAGGNGKTSADKNGGPQRLPPAVEAALAGAQRRGVSFAGDVRDTPSKKDGKAGGADSDVGESPSRAVSISGRPR
jgi:hypothetical protein